MQTDYRVIYKKIKLIAQVERFYSDFSLKIEFMKRRINSVDNPVLIYYHFQHECSIFIVKNALKTSKKYIFHMQAKLPEGKLLKKPKRNSHAFLFFSRIIIDAPAQYLLMSSRFFFASTPFHQLSWVVFSCFLR